MHLVNNLNIARPEVALVARAMLLTPVLNETERAVLTLNIATPKLGLVGRMTH